MGLSTDFWADRVVFISGHSGFKGGWLTLWLTQLGARVYGYSLEPPTIPNFYDEAGVPNYLTGETIGDVRDFSRLSDTILKVNPSIIFHLAAQPLVLDSYKRPVETYASNVMGTVNILESARQSGSVEAIVNVTTDKCYENQEIELGYRETDRLGGSDPYSSSKACAEIVAAAYRRSFLNECGIWLANARAGNVIGGGDWAPYRLIPDFFRASDLNQPLAVRSPEAIRPWQHVLEPLSGYITLAERLSRYGIEYADGWNFGPAHTNDRSVAHVLDYLCSKRSETRWLVEETDHPYESKRLKLDSSKARERLGWESRWSLETSLDYALEWHQAWKEGKDMGSVSVQQIEEYSSS